MPALAGLWIGTLSYLVVIAMFVSFGPSGCGGGSSAPAISVAVRASAGTVDGNDSTTLTATVANDPTSAGVSWTVNGGGTLSNRSTSSATYTAPAPSNSALTVTVTATSAADPSKTASATIIVAARPATTAAGLGSGAVGMAYSQQLAASGGVPPYTWKVTSGTLPACLTITASGSGGSIAGTPNASCAGTYSNLVFQLTDSGTPDALTATTAALTLTIAAAPAIKFGGALPDPATLGVAYTGSAAAAGGAGALTYSLTGALPTGLSLNTSTGAVTGTPTAVGAYGFSVTAADAYGDSTSQSYSIGVDYPISVAVTSAAGTVDGSDSTTLTATVANDRNSAGVSWTVSGGGTLSNTSASSATYTAPAPSSSAVTATVTAASAADTSKTASATIIVAARPAITAAGLGSGAVGTAYSQQLAASGGVLPYTWKLTSGTLPACLTITASASGGSIAGTPNASCAGTYGNLVFQLTDSGTPNALTATTAALTLTIAAAPAITFGGAMPDPATLGVAYAGSAAAAGGAGALTYSLAGTPPAGLSLNTSTGAVAGMPTAVGTSWFSVTASDAYGDSNSQSYSIGVSIPDASPIKHIVVIMQENRTFDNLFNGFPGADSAQSGMSKGTVVPLSPVPLAGTYILDNSHRSWWKAWDNGQMDGFTQNFAGIGTPPLYPYSYVQSSDIQPYWALATQYTLGDRMFQSDAGPSFGAHQYLIAGQSGEADEDPTSKFYGCDAPAGTTVALIGPNGTDLPGVYPCFDYQTMADTLDANGITWNYYSYGTSSNFEPFEAIRHIFYGNDFKTNVIAPQTKVLTDIANGKLAEVTWVTPDLAHSDHPASNSSEGPDWVASVVNAIGASPFWNSTAIFITWDDWGGWYDHVVPPVIDNMGPGFRVPLIVVSPYAKHGYVSHQVYETASFLTFIEKNFNLPNLGTRDATANDLSDCFDYSQAAAPYTPIKTNVSADVLLHEKPSGPPDDD